MENKTKNIIIIILSVLLFISLIFNVINFKPAMHARMQRDMMERQMPNMNDMRRYKNQPRFDNSKKDNNQTNENKTDEEKVE